MSVPIAPPKQFYYQLDGKVIGPVTGIELRNAALAGNVIPRTLVATDPNGEWLLAIFVSGLFDDGGTPLPHPPETRQLFRDGDQATQPDGQQDENGSVATSGVSEQPKQFYFKLDGHVIGPMTGIELRESALVGNVIPTTAVANDPNGEWVVANCIRGLFDEFGKPLPHPTEPRRLFNEQEPPLRHPETRADFDATASKIQPVTNSAHGGPTSSPQLSGDSVPASQSPSTAVELCPHCSREVARVLELVGTLVACPYCAREFISGGGPRQQGLPQVETTTSRLRERRSRHRGNRKISSMKWATLGITTLSAAVIILFFWAQANRTGSPQHDSIASRRQRELDVAGSSNSTASTHRGVARVEPASNSSDANVHSRSQASETMRSHTTRIPSVSVTTPEAPANDPHFEKMASCVERMSTASQQAERLAREVKADEATLNRSPRLINGNSVARVANKMNGCLRLLQKARSAAIEYNELAEHEFNDEWDLPRRVDIEELLITERMIEAKMKKWRMLSSVLD
jgi:cytoskeletal protein RodZ